MRGRPWAAWVAGLAVLAGGCGGSGSGSEVEGAPLRGACDSATSAVARLSPVEILGDVGPALRATIALERAALQALGEVDESDELAGRLRGGIAAASRTLAAVERSDPLMTRTMSPLRTAVPAARRAEAEARLLVRELCRRATSRSRSGGSG